MSEELKRSPIEIAQAGFDDWAGKPHNGKWVNRIRGTPIGNDLIVCIADAIMADRALRPSPPVVDGELWQPLETAPKDGTRVILAWNGQSCIGYYLDNSQTSKPWSGWKVPSMEFWPPGQPTLWQPLPAPPKSPRSEGDK